MMTFEIICHTVGEPATGKKSSTTATVTR